jgi:glycerate 2-kinase
LKILISPNAFKGSLSAAAAARAMAAGARRAGAGIRTVELPVADGGDGLVEILNDALGGTMCSLRVRGPLLQPLRASFCHVPRKKLAVIEMAAASGLVLLREEERDPTRTSTAGTGDLIAHALTLGATHIIVGIGGSATNDGGAGMAEALGVRFLDRAGRPVAPTGGSLGRISSIDMRGLDRRARRVTIEAVCDVTNPLVGPDGAARVYGPQKGATPAQVDELENGLANLAGVVKRDLGIDVRKLPGGGAAGGLGAGLHAFLGAALRPGVDVVLDLLEFDRQVASADLVLTGEGALDEQTAFGKAPAGVAERAKRQNVPCIAIAGSVKPNLGSCHSVGISAAFSLCQSPVELQDAMANAPAYITAVAEQAVRAFIAGRPRSAKR